MRFLVVWVFGLSGNCLWGQTSITDSIYILPEVEIQSGRIEPRDQTDKVLVLDSLDRLGFGRTHLSDLLQNVTPVGIKQYGPSGIATSSLRGGSAAQTSVLWNGFPITNPMLAQSDLSLLPTNLMDEIRITLGGGSALWGSGAVGGVISLDNTFLFDNGWSARAGMGWGAFRERQQDIQLAYGSKRSATHLQLFHARAENDFPYQDLFGENKRLEHGKTVQSGLLLGQSFRWRQHHISVHLWSQEAEREVPPTRVQDISVASQEDASLRLAADYKYLSRDWYLNLRAARMSDRLEYTDSLLNLDSESQALNYWGEGLIGWIPIKGHLLETGFQVNDQQGKSASYVETGSRQNWSWLARYRFPLGAHWTISTRLRQEWSDGKALPFIPYFGFQAELSPAVEIKGNISRSFRQPGLDDLFWNPGGNTSLLPEEGWGQELGMGWNPTWEPFSFSYRLTAFSRQIENWIQWVPGPAYWSPQNIKKVWSRGVEQEIEGGFVRPGWQATLGLFLHVVRSTTEATSGPGDHSLGQQLIYTPEYQTGAQGAFETGPLLIQYQHRWTSRSYTTADNSEWLNGFQRGNLHLAYQWSIGDLKGTAIGSIQNIWNAEYELVANRPMPGRYWELGVELVWNEK